MSESRDARIATAPPYGNPEADTTVRFETNPKSTRNLNTSTRTR